MKEFSQLVEKLFFWLLKAVYYFMKVAFGIVIGLILGAIIYISTDSGFNKLLLILFAVLGLIGGLIYAEKVRKSKKSPYYNKAGLETVKEENK